MEKTLNVALLSSSSAAASFGIIGYPSSLKNPNSLPPPQFFRPRIRLRPLPFPLRNYRIAPHSSRIRISALSHLPQSNSPNVTRKLGADRFARISSSKSAEQTSSSVGVSSQPLPPPSPHVGSPLFWVGVGVALSAVFSWVATRLKTYAMQQAFKTLTDQMNAQNNQFSNQAFSTGVPFPFPLPSASGPPTSVPQPTSDPQLTSPSPVTSQPAITVDVPATKAEAAPAADVEEEMEVKKEQKKYAFVDVSPEESSLKSSFTSVEDVTETSVSKDAQVAMEVSQNGAAFKQGLSDSDSFQSTPKAGSVLSVEALEKMMEDPTVQKMVYHYLPEEMRNPDTFKWMLQNPQYRQQLQDMLNNMSGSNEWDKGMMDSLKNFDLNSPEVKQQFDQIGLTPEEVISKIMANPDVAMAFQNPRVQQAIMDCSQNPLSIAKYQNDKEVMDVFNKISELFPGATGSP